jgi:hypothetical protein
MVAGTSRQSGLVEEVNGDDTDRTERPDMHRALSQDTA